jgi:polar amino acid transport system substrate-binding protein
MLGIIALHGIRCANLTFGSSVVVIGLGLLGLISVQILKAYGCKVFGLDVDPGKANLARSLGADHASADEHELRFRAERETCGHGVDAVLITAATKADGPVNTAVDLARFRGRIVLVGVADIHPERNEMWHKEVDVVVSKAGGPGTFDPFYENVGVDYPAGYVRWTENRNLEEFIRLLSLGKVDLKPLITHRFSICDAAAAYEGFLKGTLKNFVGIVLDYPRPLADAEYAIDPKERIRALKPASATSAEPSDTVPVGVIGAGLFGKALLLPALAGIKGVRLKTLCASSSANTFYTAEKYGFESCTTDYRQVLNSEDLKAVVVLTPHSLHAKMVCEAIKQGKHVFVEKPLCVNESELSEILEVFNSLGFAPPLVMVGYNRRFSPHAAEISDYFKDRKDPMVIHYRINSGFVPQDHWVHAEEEGGGRIVGEVCHFVDLMQHLICSDPVRVFAERISGNNRTAVNNDNVVINIKFADGSIGNIVYSASGDKAFSRERIEIFCEGRTVVSTDFRETLFYLAGKKKRFRTSSQSMGYKEELQYFFDSILGKAQPKLTANEIFLSTATVFGLHRSLAQGVPQTIALRQP